MAKIQIPRLVAEALGVEKDSNGFYFTSETKKLPVFKAGQIFNKMQVDAKVAQDQLAQTVAAICLHIGNKRYEFVVSQDVAISWAKDYNELYGHMAPVGRPFIGLWVDNKVKETFGNVGEAI